MRKVKLAYRFPDLESANRFSKENKLVIDEVIILFDTLVEEEAQEIPEIVVDKDKVIKELQKENERLKGGKEIPRPLDPKKKPEIRVIQI